MRRALLILGSISLVSVLTMQPAFALDGIQACAGDEPTDVCYGVRGVAASVYVTDGLLTGSACPSQFVSSIYVAKDYTSDTSHPNSNFIEFGFSVNRIWTCATSAKHLFIDKRINGSQSNIWSLDVTTNGFYRLLISQSTSDLGTFRFQYDPPGCGGGACRVTVPVTWNPSSPEWSTGGAVVSAEHQSAPESLLRGLGAIHDNAWVQSAGFPYTWHVANPGAGSELQISDDTVSGYCGVLVHGTGSTGDQFYVDPDGGTCSPT